MALNTAHANGGVLIHAGECILLFSDNVQMEFAGQDSREFKGERICSHDDSYILDNAARTGAVVVTRDQFRDLAGKKKEWDEVIRNRLLAPFFAEDGQEDFIQWPNDPLGRSGPTLDQFLRF